MHPNRGNMRPSFDFPGPFRGHGGFSGQSSLLGNFLGGRNPFDDPFFSDPFGNMFGSNMLSHNFGSSFMEAMPVSEFPISHEVPQQPRKPRGLIIEEINSDGEKKEAETSEKTTVPENPKRHRRSSKLKARVDDSDYEPEGRQGNLVPYDNKSRAGFIHPFPQTQSFSFQSSTTVTYGASDGACYKSSTMRTGSDGVTLEEHRRADSSTGRAYHKVSKGIHNKGHSVARQLHSDGRVDTTQALYNLDEGELSIFETEWSDRVGNQYPARIGSGNQRFLPSNGHKRPYPEVNKR